MTQEQMSGSQMEELQLFYEEVKRYQSRPLWVGRTDPQPKAIPLPLEVPGLPPPPAPRR